MRQNIFVRDDARRAKRCAIYFLSEPRCRRAHTGPSLRFAESRKEKFHHVSWEE
jgi:hypothetical protein